MTEAQAAVTTESAHAADHAEHYDPLGAKVGMWLFLFTEVLLFGALFIAFAVYLRQYRIPFMQASRELDRYLGLLNTTVLLTSSLSMAFSVAAMTRGQTRRALGALAVTLLLGAVFLLVKAREWGFKFSHEIYPQSEAMLERPVGEQVFYGLYFAMTGLHALHVIIGMAIIVSAAVLILLGRIRPDRHIYLENTGLYWHLVDIIWIFLFPLFYLIG